MDEPSSLDASAAADPPEPPLRPVPLARRLSVKLTAAVVFLTLGTLATLAFVGLREQRRHLTEEVLRGAVLFSDTITTSTRDQMLADQKHEAYRVMQRIGGLKGVQKVRIFNKEGRITYSTAPHETGTNVDVKAEACLACHAANRPLERLTIPSRARIYRTNGHRVLGMITAIDNEKACSEADCHVHPAGKKVLGVVDIVLSMEEADEALERAVERSVAFAAAAVAVLVILVWFAAHRLVLAPVSEMAAATRRIAGGELASALPVRSRDELGELAASFNAMSGSLAQAHQENRALLDGLERKVEERTAALKEAQRQVVETEKLASLGQLSASIAHEINNPLAGILTFSRLLIKNLEAGPVEEPTRLTSVKNLKLIARETERCRVIVRNLLDFARSKPPEVKDVDLNEVFREALSLTAHKLELTGIAVDSSLCEGARLLGDFGQLRQALVNLVLNACDAMPQGGRLRVATRVREDGQLEAEVGDTGCGIPPEALEKVFDPFYTTKEMGTGLGLPVVKGVAEKHGGRIQVASEPGAGTTVTLILPARRTAVNVRPDGPGDGARGAATAAPGSGT